MKRLDSGTPRGEAIWLMLAVELILLHEVLDAWFQDEAVSASVRASL
ncbi:MAG: hypothetical protein IPM79_18205 [Polyangiaceae bacterium]|nr:hypothetical protein [Polyangiaceae bacterium]